MNGHSVGLKRREPDDDLSQELSNFTLSPPKKQRSDAGAIASNGQASFFGSNHGTEMRWSHASEVPTDPKPSLQVSGIAPPLPAGEQRALVLYKPVQPPMFPGGPPAGYKVMLPLPQGTDSEPPSHQLDFESACSSDNATPSGHGLYQALDLSGSRSFPPGQRRLSRVSSCSSLPRFSVDGDDQPMVEEVDKSAELAVIPWVPTTPLVFPTRTIVEEVDDEPDNDAMMEESMDVADHNDVIIPETSAATISDPFGSPMPTFSGPWQAERLQPSFPPAMWSH